MTLIVYSRVAKQVLPNKVKAEIFGEVEYEFREGIWKMRLAPIPGVSRGLAWAKPESVPAAVKLALAMLQ